MQYQHIDKWAHHACIDYYIQFVNSLESTQNDIQIPLYLF